MVILKCDRCSNEAEVFLLSLFDFRNEIIVLPEGWFEWEGELLCPHHQLISVPATKKVEDKL